MKKSLASMSALCALLASPLAAQAVTIQFNATLSGAGEVPTPVATAATGIATLFYDTKNTATLADDTYDFAMSVFGLSGGNTPFTAASGYHIHGAANTAENAPVRVNLAAAPFVSFNSGSTLLVGGSGVAVPTIPATPVTGVNQGYAAMSFLDLLQGGLAYLNVHTALNPGGAVRGQLFQVAVVPEPSTYAMLLAGIGLVGFAAKRRQRCIR